MKRMEDYDGMQVVMSRVNFILSYGLCEESVDEGAGDADLSGNLWHTIRWKPPGIQNFIVVNCDLAACIFRGETDHE
jgi:hypothetical protein